VHTVTTGKTLIVVQVRPSAWLAADTTNRGVRLRNVTDSVDVIPKTYPAFINPGEYPYVEAGGASGFFQVAAGKQVSLDVYNGDTNNRGSGAVVICKEV